MADAPPSHKRVVIIGGGVIGCSIAYHLAQAGERDVLLLEKAQLTSGATWHAAGLVGQLRSTSNLTRMMKYSAELFGRIGEETGQDVGWHEVGSLRIASSPARWEELKRAATTAKALNFELHLVSPVEVKRLYPICSTEGVTGAAYIPRDGYVDPYGLTQAYAKGARAGGARLMEDIIVNGLERAGDRVRRVITNRGPVECEVVVNAGGLWGRQVGELAGVELPVTVVEHQYLVTAKSPLVPNGLPTMRDPDHAFYVKPEPGALAIGGWEARTAIAMGDGRLPMDFSQRLFDASYGRLEEITGPACRRLPLLNEIGVRTVINGPIPISPDGEPVMGPVPGLRNFYVAVGFTSGIAASGGAGKAMAEWILDGQPANDLWPFDLRRFGRHHAGADCLAEMAADAYARYYVVAWPAEERKVACGARRSPLYALLRDKGAVYGSKFGWERPNWFQRSGLPPANERSFRREDWQAASRMEHQDIRSRVALIDQSSFSKFLVSGPSALAALQHLAAADLDRPVGAAVYTQLLNPRGGIEADLTIMRLAEDRFYIVTGSGFGVRDGWWIQSHLPEDGRTQITDVTSSRAVINVCGPKSRDLLTRTTRADLSNASFPYMTAREIFIGYAPVLAIRLTYVGELGWELHIPTEYAVYVYKRLTGVGRELGALDAGYHAIDSLRLEKRYLYWGADIGPDTTPIEAGLEFCIAYCKSDFIGRDALLRQKERGPAQKLICLALDRALSVFGGEPIYHRARVVGITTSGNFCPTVGKSLVLGYVPTALAADNEDFSVEASGDISPARAIIGSAYDPGRKQILS
jgi:sarcosine dehydrogenase